MKYMRRGLYLSLVQARCDSARAQHKQFDISLKSIAERPSDTSVLMYQPELAQPTLHKFIF